MLQKTPLIYRSFAIPSANPRDIGHNMATISDMIVIPVCFDCGVPAENEEALGDEAPLSCPRCGMPFGTRGEMRAGSASGPYKMIANRRTFSLVRIRERDDGPLE